MGARRPLGRHDLLSYLLAGIAAVPAPGGLRFNGGAALKKMYVGDSRFSEDLDFSGVDAPCGAAPDPLIAPARQATLDRLSSRGRFQIVIDRPPYATRIPPARMPSVSSSPCPVNGHRSRASRSR